MGPIYNEGYNQIHTMNANRQPQKILKIIIGKVKLTLFRTETNIFFNKTNFINIDMKAVKMTNFNPN